MGLLNLFDPRTGRPVAIIDAAGLTDMRTGAVTAIGAKYLARKGSRVLGHIGARGTAYWNVRLLDQLFDFAEIRVHSRRPESRDAFAQRLSRDLGKPVVATADWESCVRGADIVVEASRLAAPEPMLKTAWITPRRVRRSLRDDERRRAFAHRHHGQDRRRRLGPMPKRPVRQPARARRCRQASASTLHAELGEIVAGRKSGRESDGETILLWHRGLSTSDIALGRGDARQGANAWASARSSAMHDPHRASRRCDDRQRADVLDQTRRPPQAWRALLAWVIARAEVDVRGRRLSRAAAAAGAVGASRSGLRVHVRLSVRAVRRRARRFSRRRCRARRRYGGQPVYWTDLVVAADAPYRRAPRYLRQAHRVDHRGFAIRLAGAATAARAVCHGAIGAPLFAEAVGPLVTPRNVALAVAEGRADVGPLDSYAHDLLRTHEPALAAALRVIARDSGDAHSAARGRAGHDAGRRARDCATALFAVGAAPEPRMRARNAAAARIRGGRRRRPTTRCRPTRAAPMRSAIPESPEPRSSRRIDTPRLRVKNAAFPADSSPAARRFS